MRVGTLRADEVAPAEGIEPSSRPVNSRVPDHSASLEYALVASVRAAAVSASPISFEAERRSGQLARTRRALAPSCQRARDLVRGPWFRAQDSNLSFWVQRPVSCQLDDPGAGDGVPRAHVAVAASFDAAVGPEGIEPSPSRVRAGCASSCATDLRADVRGWRGVACRRRV
jgi:hypothetical protein